MRLSKITSPQVCDLRDSDACPSGSQPGALHPAESPAQGRIRCAPQCANPHRGSTDHKSFCCDVRNIAVFMNRLTALVRLALFEFHRLLADETLREPRDFGKILNLPHWMPRWERASPTLGLLQVHF